jgi:hypothetical protein
MIESHSRNSQPERFALGFKPTFHGETGLRETGLRETGLCETGLYEAGQASPVERRATVKMNDSPSRVTCCAKCLITLITTPVLALRRPAFSHLGPVLRNNRKVGLYRPN